MITRTSRGTKRFAAAAAVALVGSTLALTSTAVAGPGATPADAARVSGLDRYATAVAAAGATISGDPAAPAASLGATPAVIVNGLNFPDGLAAAALNAPILLVEQDAIPEVVEDFLDGFTGPVRIVGGMSAVSSGVFEDLENLSGGGNVFRTSGANRYETAVEVGTLINGAGTVTDAIITTGQNFPDALAAGPLAVEVDAAILLNDGASLSDDVRQFLIDEIDEATGTVHIIGGVNAVPASVEAEIAGTLGLTVNRIAGANRDETAVAIATVLKAAGDDNVLAVNRLGFADALAAGPLAVALDQAILTVGVDSIPAATAAYHVTNCDDITDITAVGGTSVISDAVVAGAVAATACEGASIESADSTESDTKNRIANVNDGAADDGDDPQLTGTGDAAGAAGNDWAINFSQAATTAIAVDTMTNTIDFEGDFTTGITRAAFVAAWNGSDAGDLFVADEGTLTPTAPLTAVPGNIAADDATEAAGEQLGSADYTVVVTFDRLITDGGAAPAMAIFPDSNPASAFGTRIADGVATAPAPFPVAGATEVTYFFDDVEDVVDEFAAARFEIGDVTDVNNGIANTTVLLEVLS